MTATQRTQAVADLAWAGRHEQAIAAATAALKRKTVDADERMTPACAEAIRAAVADPRDRTGFFLCYRNIFMGRWIRHCALYPSWQLRLLKAGHVRYRKEGHGQREVMTGRAGFIAVARARCGGFGRHCGSRVANVTDW